jgi:hypothetical protein
LFSFPTSPAQHSWLLAVEPSSSLAFAISHTALRETSPKCSLAGFPHLLQVLTQEPAPSWGLQGSAELASAPALFLITLNSLSLSHHPSQLLPLLPTCLGSHPSFFFPLSDIPILPLLLDVSIIHSQAPWSVWPG